MERHLQEHASQLNDVASAIIEMEGMKAANKERELNGQSLAYNQADFEDILKSHELGYNANIVKARRFHE